MPKLTDNQAAAVESIDQHVIVSAGAGCGKTMVLVERYLAVLRRYEDATVYDIIAVTFTRKAAEEMRTRLKARLREMLSEQADRQRWSRLLSEVDRARIGTIHSLCESILKSHPAEAGVDPQFEVLDDLTRTQLLEESVDAALRALIDDPAANSLLLLEYPVDYLKDWVITQLSAIGQYKEARAALGGAALDRLGEHAQSVLSGVQEHIVSGFVANKQLAAAHAFIAGTPCHDPKNQLEQTRLSVLACLDALVSASKNGQPQAMAEAVIRLAEIPSPKTSGGVQGKPLRDAIKVARELATAFAKDCPAGLSELDEQAFTMLRSLVHLVDLALENFEQAKRQAQRLDYNDLIGKTHALLTAPGSTARKQLSVGIRALLVDEFQDTNRVQAELLSCLCSDQSRIFLIGDDKQSIYKFQGADVSTFNQWKSRMQAQTHGLPGAARLLDLSYSFRSHPSIVDFINRFFQFHFRPAPGPYAAHRASHQALTPARVEAAAPERVEVVLYDTMVGEGEKRDAERARTMEARAIAAWILDKVGAQAPICTGADASPRSIEFGDFAILVQANSDFAAIEAALSNANIPFVTFAGGGFLERQEILDIENMLRWLANPLDDHALLAVLRAPFFSVSDGTLHRVFLDESGGLWQCLQAAAKREDFEVTLRRPVAILKQLLHNAKTAQIADIVREAIKVTNYDVSLLAVPNGRQKSRNAWKMAAIAGQYNHLTLTEFVNALTAMRDIGAGKQTDAPLSSENAVKLMTIHKSKGLEFGAVILPVLGRKIHLPPRKLLVHRDFGIAFDTSRSSDDPRPSYYRAAALLNQEMDAQEKKRLLYVGMTRARDWLVMFVEQNARNETSFRLWLKEALAIGQEEDEDTGEKAALTAGEHYLTRYLDEESLAQWELAGSEFSGKQWSQEELDALSAEIGFDLIEPFTHAENLQAPSTVPWTATLRVTFSPDSEPHATLLGNLFHATMQRIALSGKGADAKLLDLIAAEELFVADSSMRERLVADCTRLLATYRQSTLAEMLHTARRFLPEVAYTAMNEERVPLEKRPDLIFQDDHEQWHIVDFKTDKLKVGELAAKVNEHSCQVLEYARDFENLTKFKPTAWLYFAEIGTLERVEGRGFDVEKSGQLRLPFAAL